MYLRMKILDAEIKNEVLEYANDLGSAGVDLEDEHLQHEMNNHYCNLESAILATLEASARGRLQNPTLYLIKALQKGWKGKTKIRFTQYPVRTAADFDLGLSDEERIANYQRIRQMAETISGRVRSNSSSSKNDESHEFFSRQPTLIEIRVAWQNLGFRAEVEKAINSHPSWGYIIVDNEIQQIEF